MQGVYFRVDGADLESGQDTFLIVRAASSEEAEELARKQGMLIASVRPATADDWTSRPDAAGLRPLAAMVAESRAAATSDTITAKPELTQKQGSSAITAPLGRSVFADGKFDPEGKPPARTPPVRIPPPKIPRATTTIVPPTITPATTAPAKPVPPAVPDAKSPTPSSQAPALPARAVPPPVAPAPQPHPQVHAPPALRELPTVAPQAPAAVPEKSVVEAAKASAPTKDALPKIDEPRVWNQASALVAGSVNLTLPNKVAEAPAPHVEVPTPQPALRAPIEEPIVEPIVEPAPAPSPARFLDEAASLPQSPIAEPSPMMMPTAQPIAKPAVAAVAYPAPATFPQPAPLHRHAADVRPGGWLAPLILAPLGFVSLASGIIVLALNAAHVEAADANEVNKLDLHIQSLTQTFLGGTLLLAGLLLFVTAAQVYLTGLIRAARRG
ncbi:MAG TPA: hypothetical protein VH370_25115 [Humisphaera sp.]|nr:hypothetical protein [Humisphaera sp.]